MQSSILLAADRASDAMTKKFANKLFLKYKKWIDSACKNASSDKTLWKEVIKQLSSGTTINVVIDEVRHTNLICILALLPRWPY